MARQSRAPTLLLTRPAPQSQRFARDLALRLGDAAIVISPLMQTVFLQPTLPSAPFHAVIFTSETGVKAAMNLGQSLPKLAFCVGNRTAHAARAAGFETHSADGDAVALTQLIETSGVPGPLLHLCGQDSAGDLAETLTKHGIETQSSVVYSQNPKGLFPEAAGLFGQDNPVLIPIFSPRSARLLAAALPKNTTAPLWIVAISKAAAEAAAALCPEKLVIAAYPDGENMLQAVAGLYISVPAA